MAKETKSRNIADSTSQIKIILGTPFVSPINKMMLIGITEAQ